MVRLAIYLRAVRQLSTLLTLVLFATGAIRAQEIPVLSPRAQVTMLTCGPGQELYSSFGHTALRVYDPQLGIDYVYNYGTFDFHQPNFYLNFTRGNLLYMLTVTTYKRFVRAYEYDNRSVVEQHLRLDEHQRQAVFEFLEVNALRENREYLYDYFFDNCSTRPRDVLVKVLGEQLVWDTAYVNDHRSIRQLCDDYIVRQQPWGDLGIDICLGSRIDQPSTAWEQTFLPPLLEIALDHASVRAGDSLLPLVNAKWPVVTPDHLPAQTDWLAPQPLFVALLLLLAMLVTFLRMKGWSARFIEAPVFMLVGFLGLTLLLLWFGTNHKTAAWNLNLAWAFPPDLIFGLMLLRKVRPRWVRGYALFTLAVGALLLIFWGMLPQMLHYSLRFIVILKLFLALGIFKAEGLARIDKKP